MTSEELRRRREALGLTQRALAERLGVREETVNRWERGRVPIPRTVDLALVTIEQQQGQRHE